MNTISTYYRYLVILILSAALAACEVSINTIPKLGGSVTTAASVAAPVVLITNPATSTYINATTRAAFSVTGSCTENARTITIVASGTNLSTTSTTACNLG